MNKNIIWGIVIIVILIGGWYVYKGNSGSSSTASEKTGMTVVENTSVLDAAMQASRDMVGTWQSTDDAKSTRVFNSDHTVVDVYDGETVSTGQWTTFTKATAPTVSYPLEDGKVYMQIVDSATTTETYNYIVTGVSATDLQLIYLDRGGALNYKRTK